MNPKISKKLELSDHEFNVDNILNEAKKWIQIRNNSSKAQKRTK